MPLAMDAMTEKETSSLELPFLNGAFIAIDAIDGAYIIIDGPYCVFMKAEMQYCHNIHSRLLPRFGHHRVVHTADASAREEVQSLMTDRVSRVDDVFSQVCSLPDAKIVFSTSFDFHELVNFPLREIARRHAKSRGPLLCHVPSRSLAGTWLDGYALTCKALAEGVDLRPGRGRKDAVAIVGYFRDRDEPDHAGNLRELRRLLAALGLRVVSIWLDGGGRAELEAAERAGLVISFPYARAAARIVARRIKAPLCEVDLPLGLSGTGKFLSKVASRTGCSSKAKKLIAKESFSAVRDTEAHVLRLIAGRRVLVLQNDPHLEARLRELCVELGMLVSELSEVRALDASDSTRVLYFMPTSISISNSLAHVPMGYPNYLEHPVTERPFLGYAGFRQIVDRVATAAVRSEAAGRRR